MKLRQEAIAILQVFIDRGCKIGDIIQFTDFGGAIVWDAGYVSSEDIRLGLQELIEGQYVIDHNAGLGITEKGFEAVTA